jgi:polar amino acid transport system substrate-binding protein
MRRRLVAAVAVLALLSVVAAACAKKGSPAAGPTSPQTSSTVLPNLPAFTTIHKGQLTAGSCLDYSPFEFTDPNTGKLTGFDVDMIDAIAAKLGLKVTWVKANFNTIFTALAANKFDTVAAASTITPERQQIVDFTDPYFDARQSLTVNTQKTPQIKTVDDLKSGDVIGVQKGTTGHDWAVAHLQPEGMVIKSYTNAPDAFTDLEAGQIVGVINDEGSSLAEAAKRPGEKVVQAIETGEHYGFAVSKDNPKLLEAMNLGLKAVIADGTYATIFKKWFPNNPVPPGFSGS